MIAQLTYDCEDNKFYAVVEKTDIKIELDLNDVVAKQIRDIVFGYGEQFDDDKEKMSAEIIKLKTAVYEAYEALSKAVCFAPQGYPQG